MSPLVLAVVATALAPDGGTAVALDDGTVWLVYDGEWEELGGCEDGEVVELAPAPPTPYDDRRAPDSGPAPGALEIECGDGTAWLWSDAEGWAPRDEELGAVPPPAAVRAWWPSIELSVRLWTPRGDRPTAFEGWVRLRWNY